MLSFLFQPPAFLHLFLNEFSAFRAPVSACQTQVLPFYRHLLQPAEAVFFRSSGLSKDLKPVVVQISCVNTE
jgi:hypothetical protein